MTLDKAIEIINHYIDYPQEEVRKALLLTIQTMRKYQKIEHILDKWMNEDSVGMSDYWMGKIKEVIEDGKGKQNT